MYLPNWQSYKFIFKQINLQQSFWSVPHTGSVILDTQTSNKIQQWLLALLSLSQSASLGYGIRRVLCSIWVKGLVAPGARVTTEFDPRSFQAKQTWLLPKRNRTEAAWCREQTERQMPEREREREERGLEVTDEFIALIRYLFYHIY